MKRFAGRLLLASMLTVTPLLAIAQDAVVRIGFIEPLSGVLAHIGQNLLNAWRVSATDINAKGSAGTVKFEVIPFDGKSSTQESLTVLQQIADRGIRYVAQGSNSAIALALVEAISRHNERNPGKEILLLDYAAQDPALTNERCSFSHFRFDLHTDMKMEAMTTYIASRKNIKKVYLINQDYSFGQGLNRSARRALAQKRPDIQIVGEDLHPLNQVKDFSPYITKIKASGADAIITGNWGPDLSLMIRAAKDANLQADFFTWNAGIGGMGTAIGASGADRVHLVVGWHPNIEGNPGSHLAEASREKYNDDFTNMQAYVGLQFLSEAIKRSGSTDPVRVAYAMENMKLRGYTGELEMRGDDHQLLLNAFIATWSAKDGKAVKYDFEKTGFGWKPAATIRPQVSTSCQMKRPARPN